MSIFPRGVYVALKAELEASSYLSYVDTFSIRKYRRDDLPDFENYCIVISPSTAEAVPYPASQRWVQNVIDIILLGKLHYGKEDAIIADSPSSTPPNVGVLAMYEDVFYSLYENNLGGEIQLSPGMQELDTLSRFDILLEDEREGFIFEARMGYQPRGVRFVDLS